MTSEPIDYVKYEDYLRLLKMSVKTKQQRSEINRRYYNKTIRECEEHDKVEERKRKRREYARLYYQKNREKILEKKRNKALK